MKTFRRSLKTFFRRLGYEINVYRPSYLGENPLSDIRKLMHVHEPQIVFDVGANVGTTVDSFRDMIPDSTIHAFEPSPVAFQTLEKRYGSAKNVFLNEMGVGDIRGSKTFFENSCLDMSSFLGIGRDGWGKVEREISVEVTTLDFYCEQNRIPYVSTLKIDTQGFDLEVLKGSENLFVNNKVQLILMEITFVEIYEGIPPLDEILKFLTDRNFKLVSFYKFYYKNNLAGWTDALFVNPAFTPDSV